MYYLEEAISGIREKNLARISRSLGQDFEGKIEIAFCFRAQTSKVHSRKKMQNKELLQIIEDS